MSVELVPHLPTELQDHICELAARESLQTAGRLIQVSISVSHRVGPILYEIVIIQHKGLNKGGTYYPPHIEHRSSILDFFQQHGRHIRYLLIDLLASISLIALFLQLCPSLKNLIAPTFQFSTDMIQTIERHLPDLRRLSGKFKYCLAAFDPWKGPFRHLTHLDMKFNPPGAQPSERTLVPSERQGKQNGFGLVEELPKASSVVVGFRDT
ncbi:hypothetical protein BDN72DRAFT_959539 [Pluteus cervinus]|uniref:Uncharacterized protein n=1 Tax=Pluteus cervinus TaxID=181527 RepID=A0ACD3AUP6_9AGAR|nr:hypothetical protein BDN72DRAFT_959539 [Pluteus cervinus]